MVPDDEAGRAAAVQVLREGGVVALPTDTVYGIGVALDADGGVERLFAAKRRPPEKGIMLLLGDAARTMIGNGIGRELTRDDLLELVERADREGMVLQPQNTQEPHFICCCCGCCCGVLSSAKKLPRPADYFDTNYYAEVDRGLCIECGACLEIAQGRSVDLIEVEVGGGFGARGEFYPEDFLVPFAARTIVNTLLLSEVADTVQPPLGVPGVAVTLLDGTSVVDEVGSYAGLRDVAVSGGRFRPADVFRKTGARRHARRGRGPLNRIPDTLVASRVRIRLTTTRRRAQGV